MSECNKSENELCRQFAYLIYSDVQKYVSENKEAYEEWLKKEGHEKHQNIGKD